MTSSSSMTVSMRREERTPDWAWPSTSPSRRCSRSIRDSSKPSRVAATAARRCRAGVASGMSVTRRHSPGAEPRPTRPRSWWSCETPNRSASMMTMAVALGTLTPTSMTVVATSTSASPRAKRRMTASLSSGCILPCSTSTRRPARGPRASCSATSVTARGGRFSSAPSPAPSSGPSPAPSASCPPPYPAVSAPARAPRPPRDFPAAPLPPAPCSSSSSPMRGHTTYAWWPPSTSSRTRSQARERKCGLSRAGTTWVAMGERPAGSWSRTEVSRSPKTVIATVRGMGVAVMTSRWGGCLPLPRRASRCSTPKRCCSSTTTRPRSWKRTLSSIRACVPTTTPASPVARSRRAWRRAAAPMEPVSRTTLVACSAPPSMPPCARSPIISVMERWCCWARTSVGASMAACPPASTTASMARRATIVLPLPTSPWRRRCMGWSVARSSKISLETVRWPSVRVNGRRASNASRRPPGTGLRGTAGSCASAYRRRARATWRTNASSHLSRSRAAAMSALVRGRWMRWRASGRSARPRPSRRAAGSGSTASWTRGRTASTALAIFQDSSLVVAGYRGMRAPAQASTAGSPSPRSGSYAGWASWSLRLNSDTLPANIARVPGRSSLWGLWTPLPKKTSRSRPLPSVMVTSSRWPRPRGPLYVWRRASATWATTVTCSSSGRSASVVSSPRSAYRRG